MQIMFVLMLKVCNHNRLYVKGGRLVTKQSQLQPCFSRLKGQGTKHTTVKWAIRHGKNSLKYLTAFKTV